MGNRAVIITAFENQIDKKFRINDIGIDLGWNGGRDSINAFIEYARLLNGSFSDNLRSVLYNFCKGSISYFTVEDKNLNNLSKYSQGDNGVYLINATKGVIAGRYDAPSKEQNNYDLQDFLISIDDFMPFDHKLGPYLFAEKVDYSSLKPGIDVLFIDDLNGVCKGKLVGFGDDQIVNGCDVKGLPIVDLYKDGSKTNINNYIRNDSIRIFTEKNKHDYLTHVEELQREAAINAGISNSILVERFYKHYKDKIYFFDKAEKRLAHCFVDFIQDNKDGIHCSIDTAIKIFSAHAPEAVSFEPNEFFGLKVYNDAKKYFPDKFPKNIKAEVRNLS